MWNNFPQHKLQQIKKIPFIDETIATIKEENGVKKEKQTDFLNNLTRERKWEELYNKGF